VLTRCAQGQSNPGLRLRPLRRPNHPLANQPLSPYDLTAYQKCGNSPTRHIIHTIGLEAMPDPSSGLTQLDADNRWANLKMSEVGITSTTPRDLAAYISRLGTERPYACAVGHGAPPSGGVLGPHAGAVSLVELDEEPAERAGQGAGADGRVGFDLDVEVARDDQGFALLLNRVPRAAADLEDPLGGGAGGAAHVEGGDDRVSFCSGEGGAGAERVDVGALEDAGDVHDLLSGVAIDAVH